MSADGLLQGEGRAPLTPADCDLQDFPFMPLHVARLRDSDLAAECDPEACWYAVLLWAVSWHQIPAASLPDNDAILTKLIGLGRDVKTFRKHRAEAMRGFVLCADGRLYHPVVAEQACAAWDGKLQKRWMTECARIKKANQRTGAETPTPTFEAFVATLPETSRPLRVPRDDDARPQGQPETSPGTPPTCPPGNTLQGTGRGTGTGTGIDSPEGKPSGVARATRLPPDWLPSDIDCAYAARQGFTPAAIERIAEKFRNYWTAKSGKAATKLDWPATWRNWVLEEAERRGKPAVGGRKDVDWC